LPTRKHDPAIIQHPWREQLSKHEWDRLIGELAKLRLLTRLDRAALAAYCNAYTLWTDAIESIKKYGTMVKLRLSSPVAYIANRQPPGRDHDTDRGIVLRREVAVGGTVRVDASACAPKAEMPVSPASPLKRQEETKVLSN
jgi:P27 family predicted phage terminase small subunit